MAETFWPEIKTLEGRVAKGEGELVLGFVRKLAARGLLAGALSDLCMGGHPHDSERKWEALHEYAKEVS